MLSVTTEGMKSVVPQEIYSHAQHVQGEEKEPPRKVQKLEVCTCACAKQQVAACEGDRVNDTTQVISALKKSLKILNLPYKRR